jgi:phage tail P2-like protein
MPTRTNTQKAWDNRTPVLGQLPEYGYQDNPVAAALCAYVDETLSGWADLLQGMPSALDPASCSPDLLDYIAFLFGMSTEPYWDVKWSETTKREILLIQGFLRKYKGTLKVIRTLLDVHNIVHDVYVDGQLTMPFAFPGLMGTGLMRFFILVPHTTARASSEWREVVRTLDGYCPAVTQSMVAYRGFKMGLSHFGEPMWSSAIYNSLWLVT